MLFYRVWSTEKRWTQAAVQLKMRAPFCTFTRSDYNQEDYAHLWQISSESSPAKQVRSEAHAFSIQRDNLKFRSIFIRKNKEINTAQSTEHIPSPPAEEKHKLRTRVLQMYVRKFRITYTFLVAKSAPLKVRKDLTFQRLYQKPLCFFPST